MARRLMGGGRFARLAMPAFLLAFAVTLAELSWWTAFNLRSVAQKDRAQHALLTRDAGLARDLLLATRAEARGRGADEDAAEARLTQQLRPLFFDLDFARGAVVVPRPQVVEALARTGRTHVRMFLAEGGFFASMMLAGAALILRALRREVRLVRQGQNFLAAVTHELKSPLASMRLWVETLLYRNVEDAERRRYLGIVLRDVDRLEALVGNVLSAARLEEVAKSGKKGRHASRHLSPLELGEASRAAMLAQQDAARAKGVNLTFVASAPLWPNVDPSAWALVVRNLLDNAVKYSHPASEVRVSLALHDAWATLQVQDAGVGLAPRELGRIFDKFYRVGDEMVRGSAGTGLGLHLVRATLAEHGGRVRAQSGGLGCGATFTVELPALPAPSVATLAPAQALEKEWVR